jgi:hypothetical protein
VTIPSVLATGEEGFCVELELRVAEAFEVAARSWVSYRPVIRLHRNDPAHPAARVGTRESSICSGVTRRPILRTTITI